MSEKENRMLDLLGQLPDDILDEAAAVETPEDFERLADPKKHSVMTARRWKVFGVLAACLCVLLTAPVWQMRMGTAGNSEGMKPGSSGNGSNMNGEMTTAAGFPDEGQTPTGAQEGTEAGEKDSGEAVPTDAPESIEKLSFGFGGQIYVAADAADGSAGAGQSEGKVSELPEDYSLLGSLAWTEAENPGNMETGIEMLAGCEVYGTSEAIDGENEEAEELRLYVEINGEYWLFRVK